MSTTAEKVTAEKVKPDKATPAKARKARTTVKEMRALMDEQRAAHQQAMAALDQSLRMLESEEYRRWQKIANDAGVDLTSLEDTEVASLLLSVRDRFRPETVAAGDAAAPAAPASRKGRQDGR